MKPSFETFLIELIHDVPLYVYEILITLTGVGIFLFFAVLDRKNAIRFSFKLLFWEYVFLTYSNTVFFRPRNEDISYNFSPFWSYKEYYTGENSSLLPEIVMNIVGFIPLGFLMIVVFQKLKWWQVILIGFLVSISIETLQYIFKLGIAEFDDVFNNTFGVAIGYSLYNVKCFIYNKIRRIPK